MIEVNNNHGRRTGDDMLYTPYERMWHWGQALAILALLATGLEIHAPETFHLVGFRMAVTMHNVLAFALIVNAFLALFYSVSTGYIRQYVPDPHDFSSMAWAQARYYLRGIFRGEPHPFERTRARRLNPLQRVTYFGILNVLLPLQVVTGVLIWGAQRWPVLVGSMGGLRPLASLHTLGAWLFTAFLIMHVYLTTTGETPLANIKAMIFGRESGTGPPRPIGDSAP